MYIIIAIIAVLFSFYKVYKSDFAVEWNGKNIKNKFLRSSLLSFLCFATLSIAVIVAAMLAEVIHIQFSDGNPSIFLFSFVLSLIIAGLNIWLKFNAIKINGKHLGPISSYSATFAYYFVMTSVLFLLISGIDNPFQ